MHEEKKRAFIFVANRAETLRDGEVVNRPKQARGRS